MMSAISHFQVVAHSKDGRFLVASSALTGRVWDGSLWVFCGIKDYQCCPNLTMVATCTSSGVNDALWLADDQSVVTASDNGKLEVWRCQGTGMTELGETGVELQSHDDMALSIALLAGGEKVVSAGADKKVVVWSISQFSRLASYKGHSDAVLAVAAHPNSDSCFISTSRDCHVRMWDIRKPRPASNVQALQGSLFRSVNWSSHDDNIVAVGGEMGSVVVMDWRGTNPVLLKYQPHSRDVTRLAFAPWNCNVLATVSEDTTVHIHSVKEQVDILSSHSHVDFVQGVSWHPHRPSIITCGWDGQILEHNVNTGKVEKVIEEDEMLTTQNMSDVGEENLDKDQQLMD